MQAKLALEKLKAGNQRYLKFLQTKQPLSVDLNHQPAINGQAPYAVVVSCSDSRVPVEHVFHTGLGDLFVVRVAGNILTETQIGSIEYACTALGTRLVLVLGHTHCGAVNATVQHVLDGGEIASNNLAAIIQQIVPAVEDVQKNSEQFSVEELASASVDQNVANTCDFLLQSSAALSSISDLQVLGGKYDLDSGEVDFFND
jgi:Carbonic anhydrase